MNKRILAVITAVLMLAGMLQMSAFAAGAEYEVVFERDFTAADATADGLVTNLMTVENGSLSAGSNAYKGAVYFPQNLGECYRVSGKTFYTWNSIRIYFNAEELTQSAKGFDVKNGYTISSGKTGANHYTSFKYVNTNSAEAALNGWTDLSHTVSHDYVTTDFVLSYNRGVVSWSLTGGGETREFTYDLTEGGTKEPASKSGYFVIDGMGAETLKIHNLKIEKIKNPTVTAKSAVFDNMGVYKTTDSADVWLRVDREQSEIASAKLYTDGVFVSDMTYDAQKAAVCGAAPLSGLTEGVHTLTAEVVDIYGGSVSVDAKSIYIADYTAALESFTVDNAEVTSIAKAADKTLTAKLKCGEGEEYMAMASLIKAGSLVDIKCKKITASDSVIEIAVPGDTADARVNIAVFKSFEISKPLSGNIEIK